MVQTVIFDMDGTLIDTEKYYRIFWPKAFAAFGFSMSDEQALAMRSLGKPFSDPLLKKWFGEDTDFDAIRQKRRELMEAYIEQVGIDCKPGAVELLTALKERGITTAIATATNMEQTKSYLKMTGLEGFFDRIISAHQVERGKPAPDVYLYACRELGRQPQDCIAIEDSPNGVLSAYEAGCKVIMIPDQTQPEEELKKCLYACFDNLSQVKEILDSI